MENKLKASLITLSIIIGTGLFGVCIIFYSTIVFSIIFILLGGLFIGGLIYGLYNKILKSLDDENEDDEV